MKRIAVNLEMRVNDWMDFIVGIHFCDIHISSDWSCTCKILHARENYVYDCISTSTLLGFQLIKANVFTYVYTRVYVLYAVMLLFRSVWLRMINKTAAFPYHIKLEQWTIVWSMFYDIYFLRFSFWFEAKQSVLIF